MARRVLGLRGPRRAAKSGVSPSGCLRGTRSGSKSRPTRAGRPATLRPVRRVRRDASPRRSPDTRRAGRGSCPTPAGAITAGLRCSPLQVRIGLALVLLGRGAGQGVERAWAHASWDNAQRELPSRLTGGRNGEQGRHGYRPLATRKGTLWHIDLRVISNVSLYPI